MNNIYLGVNIDHVATVRNARGVSYPDPVSAAAIAEIAGADSITTHLREDRRHIIDRDVQIIRQTIQTKLNLEMAITDEMVKIAYELKPHAICMVPERRAEVTTEGGLNVIAQKDAIKKAVTYLQSNGSECSLFIDPQQDQVDGALYTGARVIELHTGAYANAQNEEQRLDELKRIENIAKYAYEHGLKVNAGHGLNYDNVYDIAKIPYINELNIGHSIIARAIFVGLKEAVCQMKDIMQKARFFNRG